MSSRNPLLLLALQMARTSSPRIEKGSFHPQLYKNLTIPFEMRYVGWV
jgi:hypothetical protein